LQALFGSLPAQVPGASRTGNFLASTSTYGRVTTRSADEARYRLPALDITQIPDRNGSCVASWDGRVPVRCGSDKMRFIVANLGANGRADTESWPAVYANNAPATTARVTLSQAPTGELQLQCIPDWVPRDTTVQYRPETTSVELTQTGESLFRFRVEEKRKEKSFFSSDFLSLFFFFFSVHALLFPPKKPTSAGPVYLSEAPLAFTSTTAVFETDFNQLRSFTNAFPANSTLPTTAFNRYLPRVVTCVIKASDPGNNGLPVYATGQYVAIANSSSPYGIELRPNFAFPL
jgi:hypothetical protein